MRTQIIYEDKSVLVCFKPAGLAVQSGRASEPDMVSELKNYLARQGQQPMVSALAQSSVRCGLPPEKGPVYLGIIHRLDQPVSGILVFAKNQRAAADLSRQVADHMMKKTYRAIVMMEDEGKENNGGRDQKVLLTDYMVKEAGGGARIAEAQEKEAKRAQLYYRCLDCRDQRALMEIDLETGRHHQIRVQMAHAGMPLLGDARYGSPKSRELSQCMGIKAVQLQAVQLCFKHPSPGKMVSYELEKKLEL